MAQINLAALLPMFPWEGPPLPRFLGLFWPSLNRAGQGLLSSPFKQYVTGVEETGRDITPYQAPLASYQNEESWEIDWSEDGLPTRIVVHREAVRK